MRKRYVFKSFLKTASEAASLVVIGSIFHTRGPMTKKGFIANGTVSFGNVEPSMISLRMEIMMRTVSFTKSVSLKKHILQSDVENLIKKCY